MKTIFSLFLSLLLAACGGGQTLPDWQFDAQTAIQRYTRHYLAGDIKLADASFARARAAVAATGDVAAVGRIELVRCGLNAAALDFTPCSGYTGLAVINTTPVDRTYARFIGGNWQGMEVRLLPAQYAALVTDARHQAEINRVIAAIADPVSRLVASGVMVRRGTFDAATLQGAVDTAAAQGWRRPLLTYLNLQEKLNTDADTLALIRARIRLVEQSLQTSAQPIHQRQNK